MVDSTPKKCYTDITMTENEADKKLTGRPPEFRPTAPAPEAPPTPESDSTGAERTPQTPEANLPQTPSAEATFKFRLPTLRKPKPVLSPLKDAITLKIEKVMEENVGDAYARLSPIAKQEFKLKGEATAIKIRELLAASHVKVKKVLRLILDWLKMLPGINKWFLEQEAKIKTDKIIQLHKRQRDQR